jgi:hypothetical protein
MLSKNLKQQLKKVYEVENDFIAVLKAASISADEFECGALFEDMTPEEREENGFLPTDITENGIIKSIVYGIEVVTTYEDRKEILNFIKEIYDNQQLERIHELFN